MLFFKIILLILIIGASTVLGILFSKKYSNRVKELKEMKNGLNMLATKMKFTYEPIPNLFLEIGSKIGGNVGQVFIRASDRMKEQAAGEAWSNALEEVPNNLTEEDKIVLKNLSRLLGQTDLEGQISEIAVVTQFLGTQLENAQQERVKNEKMYRTLGIVSGLTMAIILI
ncbi:MAG: stage III sporulation protein AB [Clostridia bacterium]|nr:stage III sporulation protein AB [Clostridia bacterium]